MGVHISRVKSVDLDSWKTEQVRTMQRWGNKRANMYWEAKLAPGHVPSDAYVTSRYEKIGDAKRILGRLRTSSEQSTRPSAG